jgi:hypothetical protein
MKCTFRRVMTGIASAGAVMVATLWTAVAHAETDRLLANTPRYDQEYPVIDYSGRATHNRVWRLQQRLNSGELKLEWEPRWGYLRSLLKALDINPDSQVLVFSRTSLQTGYISARTPRAIYFNDDTYVGWVQGSALTEFTVIDAHAGVVFFGLDNRAEAAVQMEREGGRCLTCHDTYSMMGGGVPRVLVMSSPVDDPADTRTFTSASEVDDRTPVSQRWGGWYVTGHQGKQNHFGNLPLREEKGQEALRRPAPRDLATLAGFFDTGNYLTDKSDIAALMVLEHQSFVQNQITRVNYKVRTVMAREGHEQQAPHAWTQVNAKDQAMMRAMLEPLLRALFCADAVQLEDRIESSSGFANRFSAQGPRDRKGRSLRELDLNRRLFRYPLSYLIYSEHFDALPDYVLDYIGTRIAGVLNGTDKTDLGAHLSAADREAIAQILIDTKPRFGRMLAAGER